MKSTFVLLEMKFFKTMQASCLSASGLSSLEISLVSVAMNFFYIFALVISQMSLTGL